MVRKLVAGAYSPGEPGAPLGPGITTLEFGDQGTLGVVETTACLPNPSYLALHPGEPLLYAVHEVGAWEGREGGLVSSFALEGSSLRPLSHTSSGGADPCHLGVVGNFMLVANYSGGSVAQVPVDHGRFPEQPKLFAHQGAGPHPQQGGPRAHMVISRPDQRFVYAADLGADVVTISTFDPKHGLEPVGSLGLPPGTGPRHLVFSASGDRLYVVGELSGTVDVSAVDPVSGKLQVLQRVTTVEGDSRTAGCGAIRLSPSGKFLCASNRNEYNSITTFAVDALGLLTRVAVRPSGGRGPRDFVVDPSGRYLLVANQLSDSVNVLALDSSGGASDTGVSVSVPRVTSLLFLP